MVVKILGMHKQGFIGKQIYCIKCMGSIKLKSADFPHSRASLRKLIVFHFPSNWMRSDSGFPFDFEPNGFPFGSKSKGKLSPRSCPIEFHRKWNVSFLSAETGTPRDRRLSASWGPDWGPLKPFEYHSNIWRRALKSAPILCREVFSRWKNVQSEPRLNLNCVLFS